MFFAGLLFVEDTATVVTGNIVTRNQRERCSWRGLLYKRSGIVEAIKQGHVMYAPFEDYVYRRN